MADPGGRFPDVLRGLVARSPAGPVFPAAGELGQEFLSFRQEFPLSGLPGPQTLEFSGFDFPPALEELTAPPACLGGDALLTCQVRPELFPLGSEYFAAPALRIADPFLLPRAEDLECGAAGRVAACYDGSSSSGDLAQSTTSSGPFLF